MFWIDASDKQPCIGTGTMMPWELVAKGRQGHRFVLYFALFFLALFCLLTTNSGLPQDAVNALILAYESVMEMMKRFHADFPAHPKEAEYGFKSYDLFLAKN